MFDVVYKIIWCWSDVPCALHLSVGWTFACEALCVSNDDISLYDSKRCEQKRPHRIGEESLSGKAVAHEAY